PEGSRDPRDVAEPRGAADLRAGGDSAGDEPLSDDAGLGAQILPLGAKWKGGGFGGPHTLRELHPPSATAARGAGLCKRPMKTLMMGAALGALSLAAFGPANASTLENPAPEKMLFQAAAPAAGEAPPASTAPPKYGEWGIDLTGRDLSVKPGDNFFRYANGTWYDHFQIPADRARSGNFDKLTELSEARSRKLIEDAAAGRSDDVDAARMG